MPTFASTVIAQVAVCQPFAVGEIVFVAPAVTAVTKPSAETSATSVSLDVRFYRLVTCAAGNDSSGQLRVIPASSDNVCLSSRCNCKKPHLRYLYLSEVMLFTIATKLTSLTIPNSVTVRYIGAAGTGRCFCHHVLRTETESQV